MDTASFTRQEIEIMWCAMRHYQEFIGDDLKNDNGCPLAVIERKLWNNLDEAHGYGLKRGVR